MTRNWSLFIHIIACPAEGSFANELCPRLTTSLHQADIETAKSWRSGSSHLQWGRPRGRLHDDDGGTPGRMSTASPRALYPVQGPALY